MSNSTILKASSQSDQNFEELLRRLLQPSTVIPNVQSSSPKEITDCAHELETLHQFTGQCWSDASLIHLWFAGGIGPVIQEKLIKDDFLTDFKKFYYQDDTFFTLRYYYPTIRNKNEQYYPFLEILFRYAQEMKERFDNWKYSQLSAPLRRTASCMLTKKLEHNGILLGEMLMDPKINSKREISKANVNLMYSKINSLNLSKYKNLTVEEAEKLVESNLGNESLGYNMLRFVHVMYVLLKYFFHDKPLYVSHNSDSNTILTIKDYIGELDKFNLPYPIFDMNFYYFLHNQYLSSSFLSYKFEENVHLSFTMSADHIEYGSNSNTDEFHTISFLTCSNLQSFIYDDNIGKLLQLNWPSIFRKMNTKLRELYDLDTTNTYTVFLLESKNLQNFSTYVRDIFKMRDQIYALHEQLESKTKNESNAYQSLKKEIEAKLEYSKEKGWNFYYAGGNFENIEEIEKRIQESISNENIRKQFLEQIQAQKNELTHALQLTNFIRYFTLPEEILRGTFFETYFQFNPVFCFFDNHNSECTFYNREGTEWIINRMDFNTFDEFTQFLFFVSSSNFNHFINMTSFSIYKPKYIANLTAFVQDSENPINPRKINQNIFEQKYLNKLLDNQTNKTNLNNDDPYGGGRKKRNTRKTSGRKKYKKTRKH
jgi:hypothetical protein